MTDSNEFILPFTEIHATDLPLVGRKGANLGELTHAGFPVPPGFCLTTAAFQEFMDAAPNSAELYDLLDTVTAKDIEAIRNACAQVREVLSNVPVPAKIASTARNVWQATGTDNAYAVRSSATAEDLPDASFAGQQDTYLNIRGEADLLAAIRNCVVHTSGYVEYSNDERKIRAMVQDISYLTKEHIESVKLSEKNDGKDDFNLQSVQIEQIAGKDRLIIRREYTFIICLYGRDFLNQIFEETGLPAIKYK